MPLRKILVEAEEISPMEMEPQSLGPYELLEPLGQGGMGIVWRARNSRNGQTVALKTLRAPHAQQFAGIRREIQALAQLRHPGIVRILDEGVHQGMPWYAMEILEGTTLGRWTPPAKEAPTVVEGVSPTMENTESWWTETLPSFESSTPAPAPARTPASGAAPQPFPEELKVALRLVRRLCFTLSYLHGEGLVHRDLKPANVLVRPDGQPVIVDFGLVSLSSPKLAREALEVSGQLAGTAVYMAPEQSRGERVDARADLYSLGCVLYQLIAGRPPFVGRTSTDVLTQHLTAAPQPPSWRVPGLAPALDELVLRLLEKDPRNRLGHADDVSAALASLGVDAEPPPGAPAARAYLYRPDFSGRQDVMDRLRERVTSLHHGSGSIVFVGGESGVGKTRLLVELSRLVSAQRLGVLTGECPPPSADGASRSAPLQAFLSSLQSVADRCRELGGEVAQRLLGASGPVLEPYQPALRGLPGLEQYGPSAELPAKDALLRVYRCLLETLSAVAKRLGGLVLLLDDLQWADELSLGALETLVRSSILETVPLLVVVSYRPEECGPALSKLTESRGASVLSLARLGGPEVTQIVSDMLGLKATPQSFAAFLLHQSEGNPFFVAEYLRAMVAQGLLYRDEAGAWQVARPEDCTVDEEPYAALPLPRSLLELVSGRLSRLGPEALSLVEALSVLGREADGAQAAAVSGLSGSELVKATHEAFSREVLEPADDESQDVPAAVPGPRLRFVHDKLREVAYARLAAQTRRELHRAAAEVLEEAAEPSGQRHADLALHWVRAGEPRRARPHQLAAARQALARHALQEAEAFYRAYLEMTEEPSTDSIAVRNELGEKVLALRGRNEEALAEHEAALQEARGFRHRTLEAQSLRLLGQVYWRLGQAEQARQILEQSLAICLELGDRRLEGVVLANLASAHVDQGRLEQARQLHEQALAIHRETRDRRLEGFTLGNLANVFSKQSQMEPARQLFEQALAIHREVGDRRVEGVVLGNLGILDAQKGRWAQARMLFEQALEIHREVGDRQFEGIVLGNLANLHQEEGSDDQARQLYEQALEIHREIGNRRFEGVVLGNLANLYTAQGRMEQAQQLYERALELARELSDRWVEGIWLGKLGALELLSGGDLERADVLLGQGMSILGELGDKIELGQILCEQGHLALARGRGAEALLARSRALAEELEAGAESALGKRVDGLDRAQKAFAAGAFHDLFQGRLAENYTPDQRRWLAERGRMPGVAAP